MTDHGPITLHSSPLGQLTREMVPNHELFMSPYKAFWLVLMNCFTPNQITDTVLKKKVISLQVNVMRGDEITSKL